MAATVEEVLMAAGSFSFDCEYDIELAKALIDDAGRSLLPGPHLMLYRGEELWYQGPVLGAVIDPRGIKLTGRSNIYWLGESSGDGPTIADREYVGAGSRLGNGAFELGGLYWKLEDQTKWAIGTGGPVEAGIYSAVMSAVAAGGDDVLKSDETFETHSPRAWIFTALVKLIAGAGNVRVRLIAEGVFRPANLVANADFAAGGANWTTSTNSFGSPAAVFTGGQLQLGPIPQRQVLSNPKFDLNTDGWNVAGDPHWYLDSVHPFSPAYSMTTAGTPTSSNKEAFSVAGLGSGPGGTIQPGERYRLDANILPAGAPDGEAYASVTYPRHTDPSTTTVVEAETQHIRGGDKPNQWRNVSVEFDSESFTYPVVWLRVRDHTTDYWSFDDIYLTRIVGNEVVAESAAFAVVPQFSYTVAATVQSAVDGQAGEVVLRMRLSGTGRPDIVVPVASTEHTQGQPYRVTGTCTPPSGYDVARLQIVGRDILGSYFSVDDVDVRQADAGVVVHDSVFHSSAAGSGWNTRLSALSCPAGTDRVRVEVVAEQGSAWAVDSASLNQTAGGTTGVTQPTTGDVAKALLKHPDTGLQLLPEGLIVGTDLLVYDWRLLNVTNRAALDALSRSGVASPTREWRVHPDGPVDWGTTAQIFNVRDLVFTGPNLLVLDGPDVEISAEGKVEKVRVIGAERRKPNGDRTNLTGEATNPSTGADFFGRPPQRTRVITDSQVDHPAYAAGLARQKADEAASSEQSLRVRISDWAAEEQFDVGDTVGLYKPESGLADPANEHVGPDGEVTFPARRRVLARTTRCGAGDWRAELRLPDGSTLPLKVRWEAATTADLEVGAFRREFLTDPQGGPAGAQFTRYRASLAR